MPTNKLIVGAYATAPSTTGVWDASIESQYYRKLAQHPLVGGIEHPFTGSLHPHDDQWFLENIAEHWQIVFTSIPGVMAQLSQDATFGIASTCQHGRAKAMAFYKQASQAIHQLNQHCSRQVVSHIQIHSAPINQQGKASKAALVKSLTELASWDWYGAKLVLEHCDAFIEDKSIQKGFLGLEDEIAAIKTVNTRLGCGIGMSINWGRSAIEGQSAQTPLTHIQQLTAAGLLRGLVFSGATDQLQSAYGVWTDSHVPVKDADDINYCVNESLMTKKRIAQAINNCHQPLEFVGGKISLQPNTFTVDERVGYNDNLLQTIATQLAP